MVLHILMSPRSRNVSEYHFYFIYYILNIDRLWQHEAMNLCLGGLYPCQELVQKILDPTDGMNKRILDLGTSWLNAV
jgi:hypothetical protein